MVNPSPSKAQPQADMLRILATMVFFSLAVLVVFNAMDFWMIQVQAVISALSSFKPFTEQPRALLIVHVATGSWALLVSLALFREVILTKLTVVRPFVLYLFLVCFLGQFMASMRMLDSMGGAVTALNFVIFSGPGCLALGLGLVSTIFGTGIPQLDDKTATSTS